MAISLAALLGVPSLKLTKAGLAETTWHQDILWVAVTEQEDPQRFLNGGELVLTTGMRLKSAPDQRRFVRQVQRAGAVGIGFGIGLTHDAVPPALIAEANRWGLPVVEVPYETPFIAIGKLVADAQSADHYAKLERLIAGHQILARALLTGGGLAELLKHLGSHAAHRDRPDPVHRPALQQRARPPGAQGRRLGVLPDPHRPPRRLHALGQAAVRGLGHRGLRPEPDQRRAEQHGQAAAVPARPGRAGPRGRHPRDPGAQRSHPPARRHRHQQHPQERGPACRVRGAPQAARELFAAAAARDGGERRRREGPGRGDPRRRQRRQRAGPQPQRPPGRGRASTPRSASAGPTRSPTACAGATSRPATRPATACRSTNPSG